MQFVLGACDKRSESEDNLKESCHFFKMKDEKTKLVIKTEIKNGRKNGPEECKSDPAEFTDIVGSWGKWQIKIMLWTMLSHIPTAWNHLGMSFLAYPQDHWCMRPISSNLTLETWLTDFLPNETIKGKVQHSQCQMFINNGSYGLFSTETEPCSSWEYTTDFNSLVTKWNLVCENEWQISVSQSIYMFGFLFAVFFSGQFSDLYGRHPTIMLNIVILLAGGLAAAYSNSFFLFTLFRFFIGLGHAGMGLVVFVLFMETIGSQNRAKYVIIHGLGWPVGYMLLPLLAWLVPNWFLLQIAMTLPCLFFIAYYWLIPESPRWLLSNGNLQKAIPILEDAAKTNGVVVKDMEDQLKKLCCLENKEKQMKQNATFLDLLRTPKLRKKTLCIFFIWLSIGFAYYGISLNTNDLKGNDFLIFFLAGLMEIPATIYCLFTLDRFGRRKPFIFSLLLMGLACVSSIFIPEKYAEIRTGLALCGKMAVSASFIIVYIYSAEIFPTVARNVGVGSSSTVARIGSSIAPFMRDLGKVTNPAVPMLLFGVLSLISSALVIQLPETNNVPVPETLAQAELFGKETIWEDDDYDVQYIVNSEESD